VRSAMRAAQIEPGFRLESGVIAEVDPSLAGYDEVRGRQLYAALSARLSAIPGVEVHKPQGAFYLFAGVHELIRRAGLQGDVELCGVLLDQARVAVVPGSAFHAEGFLRLSYATSLAQLERAAGDIARVFGQL